MTFELTLESEALSKELTKDLYVSVRVGDAQKLSKFATSRTFRFPKAATGDRRVGKVELFRRIAGHNIEIHSAASEHLQEVPFEDVEQGLKFQVSCQGVSPAAPDPNLQARLMKPKAAAAKEYMDRHALELRLSEAMQVVLRERPEDPIGLLCEILKARPGGIVIKKPLQQDKRAAKHKVNGLEEKKTSPEYETQGESAAPGARAPATAERALLPKEQEDAPQQEEVQPDTALKLPTGKVEEEKKEEEKEVTRALPQSESVVSPKAEERDAAMPEEEEEEAAAAREAAPEASATPAAAVDRPIEEEQEKEATMEAAEPAGAVTQPSADAGEGADAPADPEPENQEWKEETLAKAPVSEEPEPAAPVSEEPEPAVPVSEEPEPAAPVPEESEPVAPVSEEPKPAAPVAEQRPAAEEQKEEETTGEVVEPVLEEPAAPVQEPPAAEADEGPDVPAKLAPETQERKEGEEEEEAPVVAEAPVSQEPAAVVAQPSAEAGEDGDGTAKMASETQEQKEEATTPAETLISPDLAGTQAHSPAEAGECDEQPAEQPLETQEAAAQEVVMTSQEPQATRKRPFQIYASVGTWYLPLPELMVPSADEADEQAVATLPAVAEEEVAQEAQQEEGAQEELMRSAQEQAPPDRPFQISASAGTWYMPLPDMMLLSADEAPIMRAAAPSRAEEALDERFEEAASPSAGVARELPVAEEPPEQKDKEQRIVGAEDKEEVEVEEEETSKLNTIRSMVWDALKEACARGELLEALEACSERVARSERPAAVNDESGGDGAGGDRQDVVEVPAKPQEDAAQLEVEPSPAPEKHAEDREAAVDSAAPPLFGSQDEAPQQVEAQARAAPGEETREPVVDAAGAPPPQFGGQEDEAPHQVEAQEGAALEEETREPVVDSAATPPPQFGGHEDEAPQQVEAEASASAEEETREPIVDQAATPPPQIGSHEDEGPQQVEAQASTAPEEDTREPVIDSAAALPPKFGGEEERAEVAGPSNQEKAQPSPLPPPAPAAAMEAEKEIRESDELEDAFLFEDIEQERTSVCGLASDYSPKASTVVAMQAESALPPAPPPSREKEPRRQNVQVIPVSNLYGSGFHRTGVAPGLVFL